MKLNDITVSTVVDTDAEIKTVAQSVAHVKLYPQPKIIFSKDVNLAACWESMTENDRRGLGHTACVRCTITGRHAPWYRFPAFNGCYITVAPGTLKLGFNLRSRQDPLDRLFWCVV